MSRKASKLLERMRRTKAGWKPKDLIKLYKAYGFEIKQGGKHDIVKHPEYPNALKLRDTIPRGNNDLPTGYASDAVKKIDLFLRLQGLENENE